MPAMQVLSSRPAVGQRATVRPSRVAVRAMAQMQGPREQQLDFRTIAAGFATATLLLTGSAANAGVILEQPEVKKLFQSSGNEKPAKTEGSSAPAAPKAAPKPKASTSSEGGEFDVRTLVLPLSVLGLAGAGFALSKVDPEFASVVGKGSLKPSDTEGAGYETALKAGGEWPKYEIVTPAGGARKAKSGTVKVGTGLFGKKK